MDEILISVTVAARNFSDCINRVRYQGTSFIVEKNGVPVARIIPAQPDFATGFERHGSSLRQTGKIAASDSEKVELPVKASVNEGEGQRNQEPPRLPKRPTLNW